MSSGSVSPPRVWAVHDGRIGITNQVLGLAEAVGWPVEERRIDVRFPWRHLAPQLWPRPLAALSPASDRLGPPWPDLLVGCGRLTAAPAAAVRKASGGRTFVVQIQDPKLSPSRFDLLVVPEHDRLRGANVLVTRGAVHRVTPERLKDAASRFAPRFENLPRPLIAVLIGGNNKAYRLTTRRLAELAEQLAGLARHGAGLLVTPSRRTGPAGECLLREALAGLPARIWDGGGDNPYFGYLALADAILVTEDSVSMTSEAASTGKPVYVISLEGAGSQKFRQFHASLRSAGVTRPFEGEVERWTYEPLDDTARAAAEIQRRMAARAVSAKAA